jgi:hypothetical protein
MQLDPKLKGSLRVACYEAGHRTYVREADHRRFREDYLRLVQKAMEAGP